MLHLSVTSSRPTLLYQLIDFPFNGYGGHVLNVAPLLAYNGTPETLTYSIPWGKLEQGKKSFGPLRDKSVSHSGVGGNVEVNDLPSPSTPLPANCGIYYRGGEAFSYGEDLPAGEVRLYGDYVRAWEDQAHLSECTVTEVDGYVFQTCLHIYPKRFAEHWTGRIDQLSDSGCFGYTYTYMWSGDELFTGPVLPSGFDGFTWNSKVYAHDRMGMESFLDDSYDDVWFEMDERNPPRQGIVVSYEENFMDSAGIVSYVEERLRNISTTYVASLSFLFPESEDEWGQLSLDCADQLKLVDKNLIFLLYDIVDLTLLTKRCAAVFASGDWDLSLIKRLNKMGVLPKSKQARPGDAPETIRKRFTSGKSWRIPKTVASMYLLKTYAVDSFVDDVAALSVGFQKFLDRGLQQRLHARGESFASVRGALVHRKRVLTVECGQYPDGWMGKAQSIIGDAKQWGLYPNLANLYDAIKYSFVANWFVNFGKFLSEVDQYQDLENYFPVSLVIQSTKDSYAVDAIQVFPDLVGVSGDVEFQHYRRWCSYELPLPTVNLRYGTGLDLTRSVQTSALLVQRFAPSRR